ncbi:MAG: HD domain-containing protein [Clostridia bacterium]|nr:HD domain-containing protein [Clostridia bacterium]
MELSKTKNIFLPFSVREENAEKWENSIKREVSLPKKAQDIRSEFARDYTRIIHSRGYRRLKHKTQVFFAPENDHICTRIEHVNHVESVSYTIANHLGLNTELTRAIATAHDLGHAPFGHLGERILNNLCKNETGNSFWHEQNGLFFADNLELLKDSRDRLQNLNLTYAVRDGIISHCGEVNQNMLFPRNEAISLNEFTKPNMFSPYSWEGCVVKICDKISYLGRDMEDAVTLGLIEENATDVIKAHAENVFGKDSVYKINTTNLISLFVYNLCITSSPEKGLGFSPSVAELMQEIMNFNYREIYGHSRLKFYEGYANEIIGVIFKLLASLWEKGKTFENLEKAKASYPLLVSTFSGWLYVYSNSFKRGEKYCNKEVFNPETREEYIMAIIYFISGMTDSFIKKLYSSLGTF